MNMHTPRWWTSLLYCFRTIILSCIPLGLLFITSLSTAALDIPTVHLHNNINHFYIYDIYFRSQDNQVTRLQAGWSQIQILAGARGIFLLQNIRLDLGLTHPPIQWVLEFFPGCKVPGAWSSPLPSIQQQS